MINISLEDGIELINSTLEILSDYEEVYIEDALNRVAFCDVNAKYDNPPFNRSAVDGYCCRSEDLNQIPVKLKVVDQLCAGDDRIITVKPFECVKIMTGAEIPDGLDCCIRQEDTDRGNLFVEIQKNYKRFDNYCFQGEDYKEKEVLITKMTTISYVEIGLLASMGYTKVKVYRLPKIAIISTGDEVLMNTEKLSRSKIYNSNIFLIEARLRDLGINNIYKAHINDDHVKVIEKIKEIYNKVDLVITTGGVSVGVLDIFHEVVKGDDFKQMFWKLQIQPGTPIMYSLYKNLPVISLSGNPFAALVNLELVVRHALYKLCPNKTFIPKIQIGILQDEFNKKSINRRFIRAYFENDKVYLNKQNNSSGVLSTLKGCNCLLEINKNTVRLLIGDEVKVHLI